jgi:hypothetical protein
MAVKFGLYHLKITLLLRRVFGTEMQEIMGGLIIMHSYECVIFIFFSKHYKMIKLMSWAGYVARKKPLNVFGRQLKGRDRLEDSGVDGKML